MAKTETPVDCPKLKKAVEQVESNGPLANQFLLFEQVCEVYNQSNPPRHITPSVVRSRILQKWSSIIPIKTQPGRRKGMTMSDAHKSAMRSGKRIPKAQKFARDPQIVASIAMLRQRTPLRFQHYVDQVEQGSRRAADVLKCLNCSNYMTPEIRQCKILACSLYPFRPFQKPSKEDTVDESNDVNEISE